MNPQEQAQLDKDIQAFLETTPKPETPGDEWENICEQLDLLDISDKEESEEELDSLYDEWVIVRIDKLGRVYQRMKLL